MKKKIPHGRAWLVAAAKSLASGIKASGGGSHLRARGRLLARPTNTDGWAVVIGDVGKNQPRLEIWLDRFSGHPGRKLWAGFHSDTRASMTAVVKRVSKEFWPIRTLSTKDTSDQKFVFLTKRLAPTEFHAPILEKYSYGYTWFGLYDSTREASERTSPQFSKRAVAFFEDVANSLSTNEPVTEHQDVYPRHENRKQVKAHLQRERSRLLATDRKILDKYTCQVCGMRFEDVYGKALGSGYAEAHHIIPLSQLRGTVLTRIEDLRTVCANCHRMLHHMEGRRGDIAKLRRIVKDHI